MSNHKDYEFSPLKDYNEILEFHSKLLSKEDQSNDFFEDVKLFIKRTCLTGSSIINYDKRRYVQSLLDYWCTVLLRAEVEAPESTLIEATKRTLKPIKELPEETRNFLETNKSPYLGLESFSESQNGLFFGRERLISRLTSHVKKHSLLVISGPSGMGKTSLVLSGLLPKLHENTAFNLSQAIILVPGEEPTKNFAKTLKNSELNSFSFLEEEKIGASLKDNPNFLVELFGGVNSKPVIFFVDDFEEIITLCQRQSERDSFVNNLFNLVAIPNCPHKVILSFQSDFEEKFIQQFPKLRESFYSNKIAIDRLSRRELREVIEKPAELIGLKFEDGLVDALVKDFSPNYFSSSSARLPLLQFALLKLWDERESNWITWNSYERLGGEARQILPTVANKFYEKLSPVRPVQPKNKSLSEQEIAKKILLAMIQPGMDESVISKSVTRDDLHKLLQSNDNESDKDDRIDKILDDLVKERLVKKQNEKFKFSHESLANNWPLLKGWLQIEVERRLRQIASPIKLTLHALQQMRRKENEVAALLVRQAYLLSQRSRDEFPAQYESIDEIIRLIDFRDLFSEILRDSQFSHVLKGHNGEISQLCFGCDQSMLFSASYDGSIRVWNLKNHEKSSVAIDLKGKAKITAIAVSCKNKKLAFGCSNGKVEIWEFLDDSFNSKREFSCLKVLDATEKVNQDQDNKSQEIHAISFSPDGNWLATGGWNQPIQLFDLENLNKNPIIFSKHKDWIWSLAFSPDGKTVAGGCRDGSIWLWQPFSTRKISKAIYLNKDYEERLPEYRRSQEVFSIAYSPEGKWLAAGSRDNKVRIWKMGQKKPILQHCWKLSPTEKNNIRSVVFSPDGTMLASGGDDQSVQVWDVKQVLESDTTHEPRTEVPDPQIEFDSHFNGVSSLAFSPDSKILAAGCWDWKIQAWEIEESGNKPSSFMVLPNKASDEVTESEQMIFSVVFNPLNEKEVAFGRGNGEVGLWDFNKSKSECLLSVTQRDSHCDKVRSIIFTRDGKYLITGSEDKKVRFYNLRRPSESPDLIELSECITSIMLSPDAQKLAVGSRNGTIWLFDLPYRAASKPQVLKGHQGTVWSLTFMLDGQRLISGSEDKTVKVWNLDEKDPKFETLLEHQDRIRSVAISSNEQILAVGGGKGEIMLKNLGDFGLTQYYSTKPDKILPVKTHGIGSLAFRPNSQSHILAVGDWDHKIQIWNLPDNIWDYEDINLSSNITPLILGGHTGGISSLSFSQDGNYLASASHDGTVRIWEVDTQGLANSVCQRVWRNLSREEWNRFVGKEIEYQKTCEDRPFPEDS
jgi:WD40 repeat protein